MTAWVRMAPVSVMPRRYRNETDPDYNARVYRWRTWAHYEPRPDLWFTPEQECQAYRLWLAEDRGGRR